MPVRIKIAMALAGFAIAVLPHPAIAQKSKDTVRYAITTPLKAIDSVYFTSQEAAFIYKQVYETLLYYEEDNHRFVPGLAKSWKRIDPTTLEFELRDNISFHNGDKFDADDIVYLINWLCDPGVKIPFKQTYSWIKGAEKVGNNIVRIRTNEPTANDMIRLAYRLFIFDSKVHRALDEKADYGRRSPIGTGPYKVAHVDPDKGVVVERNPGYNTSDLRTAHIGRFSGIPVYDRQAQIAQLLTGNLDLMAQASSDDIKEFATHPDYEVGTRDSNTIVYLQLDAIGVAGRPELKDVRVRKAIMMAINREAIAKLIVVGGSIPESMCPRNLSHCDYSTKAPAYDPQIAKNLLKEAGYPNGFDLEIVTRTETNDTAVAITGDLRKIGIRASVSSVPLVTYRKLRSDGKLQAAVAQWPAGGEPDAANTMNVFFASEDGDYWRDSLLKDALRDGLTTMDSDARKAVYRRAFDHINTQAYLLPITTQPISWVQARTLQASQSQISPRSLEMSDFAWK